MQRRRLDFSLRRNMTTSTFEAISTVLVEQFHVEPGAVRAEVALDQLGLDSLALMEFVFAVEDRFDVRIPEDRLDPRQAGVTLEQLAGLLDEAIAAKASRDVVSG
jgi:acyl carrier protein